MFLPTAVAEEILGATATALRLGDRAMLSAIDDLPLAIYAADFDGFITYFNTNCIAFAGREPVLGQDRWCVTWKLYTEAGEFLPHAECPMAIAIRQNTRVRGVKAVAERPDGTRIVFMPYPTPLLNAQGALLGGVNMLIDITEPQQALSEGFYDKELEPWLRAVIDRVLASFSIAEVRTLIDEIETKVETHRPRHLH